MKNNTPEKPERQKDQISQLWDAVFNHIPTRLGWVDVKVNFILGIMGVMLALMAVVTVLVIR